MNLTGKTPAEMQEMLREVDLSHERVEYRHSTIFAKTIYGVIGECAMIEARSQKRQAEEAAEAEKSRERSRKEWAGGGTIGAILLRGGDVLPIRISPSGEIRVPAQCAGLVIGKQGHRIKDIRARVNPRAYVVSEDKPIPAPKEGAWKY